MTEQTIRVRHLKRPAREGGREEVTTIQATNVRPEIVEYGGYLICRDCRMMLYVHWDRYTCVECGAMIPKDPAMPLAYMPGWGEERRQQIEAAKAHAFDKHD
jgi:hypothetical protein